MPNGMGRVGVLGPGLIGNPGIHPKQRTNVLGAANQNPRYWVKSGLRGDGLALTGETTSWASAPQIAAYSITGNLEIVARVTTGKWITGATNAMTIVSNHTNNSFGYGLTLSTAGLLQLSVALPTTTTAATTAAVPFVDGETYWVKVTRVAATGVVTFQYALDQATEPSTWMTLAGSNTTSGNMVASTTVLGVGATPPTPTTPWTGGIFRVIVRNGIAGTTAFDANFAAQTLGASSFTESSANAATVTINGSQAGLHDGRLLCNGSTALGSAAYCTDTTTTLVTGDIDVRCLVAPTTWTPASIQGFMGRNSGIAGGRSWSFILNTAGTFGFLAYPDYAGTSVASANSSAATGFGAGVKKWVRVTWRASDGRVQFFTADGTIANPVAGDWVQLGTNQTANVGSLYPSTAALEVGVTNTAYPWNGSIYRAQLYNGIAGALVFDADFSTAPSDVSNFKESANNLSVIVSGGAASASAPGFGTWSTTATATNHWSNRSNGYPGYSVPNSATDVIFDRYSGRGTTTLGATLSIRSFDSTDAAMVLAFSNFSIQVGDGYGGAWTTGINMGLSGTGAPIFNSTNSIGDGGRGWPIKTNGIAFPAGITFQGAGGRWYLADDWVAPGNSGGITHTAGVLDLNGKTITMAGSYASASNASAGRTLIANGATVNITGVTANWSLSGTAPLNLDVSTLTINFTAFGGTNVFAPFGKAVYGSVNWVAAGGSASTSPKVSGGDNVNTCVITNMTVTGMNAPTSLSGTPTFDFGTNLATFSVTNLTIRGAAADQPIRVGWAGGSGTAWQPGLAPFSFSVANPPTLSDVIFQDITAAGASTPWTGTRLQNGGGSSNITFISGQDNYWVPAAPRLTGSGFYTGTARTSGVNNAASVPDSVALSITGDLDLRAKIAPSQFSALAAGQAILCKGNVPGTASRSYMLQLLSSGFPVFTGSANGTTQFSATASAAITAGTPYGQPSQPIWLRCTRVSLTGAVTFYTSSDGITWTQLGNQITSTAGALFDSPDPLYIGNGEGNAWTAPFGGTIYRIQILNGIAGTTVFDANFETATANAASFTESSVNAATVTMPTPTAVGSGDWSDAQHWASTSGGTVATGRVPLVPDSAFIDASSGTGTISGDRVFHPTTVDFTNSTITAFAHIGMVEGVFFGSLTLGTVPFTITSAGSGQNVNFMGRSTHTLDTQGVMFGNRAQASPATNTNIWFHNLGGSMTLASDFVTPNAVILANTGSVQTPWTFNANDKNATVASVTVSSTPTVMTIAWGNGVWKLTGITSVISIPNQANTTFTGSPQWQVPETYDGVVSSGKYRIPQYATDPANTTAVVGNPGANSWSCASPTTALTGDLDIRFRMSADSWTGIAGNAVALFEKWSTTLPTTTTGKQWAITVNAFGQIAFAGSTDGTTTNINPSYGTTPTALGTWTTGTPVWIRFTRVASTGVCNTYYSLDATNDPTAVSWSQLGSANGTSTAGSMFNAASDLAVGTWINGSANNVKGVTYYYAGVSNSTSVWSPVASIDFTTMNDYALSATDAQGNVWRNNQASCATARRILGGRAEAPSMTASNSLWSPDSAALAITGDIDIQVRARSYVWSAGIGMLVAKSTGTTSSFYLIQGGANGLVLQLNSAATTGVQANISQSLSTASGGVITNGWQGWLRATWRQSDGRVQFFYAPDSTSPPGAWTQLGTDKTIAIASIFTSTAPLEIGIQNNGLTSPAAGTAFYRVRILNGIAGTAVFDADFTSLQDDTFAFKESSANQAVVHFGIPNSAMAGTRVVTDLSVTGKTLPGTLTATPSGRILYLHGITSPTLPAVSITGGKWVATSQSQNVTLPSLTLVSGATGPRSAFFSAADNVAATTTSGGTISVWYADIYKSTALGASAPFTAAQSFDAGQNTSWNFFGLPGGSTMMLMGV